MPELPMRVRLSLLGSLAVVAVGVAACAGTPPPDSQIAVANTKISDAERAGGMQYAPNELTAARAKLDQAREATRKGDNKVAARLADEAAADAQLADVKARAGAQAAASTGTGGSQTTTTTTTRQLQTR
jgi:hypothetical protein